MSADSPYQRIVAVIRERIASGELRPGDRVPSIRQLAGDHGVAIATATRAMATLRDEGLVEARVGAGTVVSARANRQATRRAVAANSWPGTMRKPPLNQEQVLATAISIADAEGLEALSMRRLATELDTGPMSLYRYVEGKDDLVKQMADDVFGRHLLPEPGPDGWRAKLELASRLHWELYQRHLWLPRVISFTRPMMMPNAIAHTGWMLQAIDGIGLSPVVMLQEAITLSAYVVTVALTNAAEIDAGLETGLTIDQWWTANEDPSADLVERFPALGTVSADAALDLDELFEYGLARHLDGLALLIDGAGAKAGARNSVRP
ncbi:GntR family transcriptional regulator [Flindersiella endophytica]